MSRMMIYINYPLSSQLTKFVTVTLTFVTVSYIVSYVRNQQESYTLTSLDTRHMVSGRAAVRAEQPQGLSQSDMRRADQSRTSP
jgi:hypothetical protein